MRQIWMVAILCAACGTTLRGRAQDDNPFFKADHISEGIAIPTKDAQIISAQSETVGDPGNDVKGQYATGGVGYYHPTFHQSAIFQAPNQNQVIFLVELTNRWPELTHAETYEVTLIDDLGHKFLPRQVTSTHTRVIRYNMNLGRSDVVHMVVITPGGTHVYTHGEDANSGDMKAMMGARSLIDFRGDNIVTPQTRKLVLRLQHKSRTLEFVWDFKK